MQRQLLQPARVGVGEQREVRRAGRVQAGGQSSSSGAATGTLLQGLLGTGETPEQASQRKESLKRLRTQANTPSRAYGKGEPMLDYLLGGDQ